MAVQYGKLAKHQAGDAQALAQSAEPLGEPGRPTNEERQEKGVVNTVIRGSTNFDYLPHRIGRDHPAILERMKAGDFNHSEGIH